MDITRLATRLSVGHNVYLELVSWWLCLRYMHVVRFALIGYGLFTFALLSGCQFVYASIAILDVLDCCAYVRLVG